MNWPETRNLLVEGDCLEVLKLLQKSYFRRVDVIYLDPPYNTGTDQIYPDSWDDDLATYLQYTRQAEGNGLRLAANTETAGRYHTKWLNMMLPRLMLARNLLREHGVIYASIDDHESHNLRLMMDEVFGPENFICSFAWQKRYSPPPDTTDVGYQHESVLMYRRSDEFVANKLSATEEQVGRYKNPDNDPRGPWKAADYTCRYTSDERPTLYYPIRNPNTGKEVLPKKTRVWNSSKVQTRKNLGEDRLWWGKRGTNSVPALKNFISEVRPGRMPGTLLLHDEVGHTDEASKELRRLLPDIKFPAKPTRLIEHLCMIGGSKDAMILDLFAGCGTTGQAVYQLNVADGGSRRFILVQLPEKIDNGPYRTVFELARFRVQAAGAAVHKSKKSCADTGFKVFRLDSSNIKPWDADFESMENGLIESIDNIKADRSEDDILYELLLKYGLDLAIPSETRKIEGRKVTVIGAGALVVCLADDITLEVVSGIAALKDELKPEIMRVVFKDSGFTDDVVKTNAAQILLQAGIDDVKSL